MNDNIYVLVTEGKHDIVEYATLRIFKTYEKANSYCKNATTEPLKYWKKAIIIESNEQIKLTPPERTTA